MSEADPSSSETNPPAQAETNPEGADTPTIEVNHPRAHWRACMKLTFGLLAIWFVVSFGAGILLRDWLDASFPKIGTAPFGFWMAQQGSIIVFVLILITYAILMNKLDAKHGYSEER